MNDHTQRLQKLLAGAGLGSRREIEGWISEGKIKVDGKVAKLGDKVTGNEQFEINQRRINLQVDTTTQVIAYHKPTGEMSTRHDPEGRPTIFDNLPKMRGSRWVAIGRLDINTSGLLLLTTNGELANRLMHPSRQIEREYAVRILGHPQPSHLQQLRDGIELEDGIARFQSLKEAGGEGANRWYHVILTEGKRHEVRRLWESLEFTVSRLMRIRYGVITLPSNLPRGRSQQLEPKQIKALMQSVDMTYQPPTPTPKTNKKMNAKQNKYSKQTTTRKTSKTRQSLYKGKSSRNSSR